MAELVIKIQPDEGQTFVLPSEHSFELRIGRDESSDIFLQDTSVSRRHASIVRDGDRYVLKDTQSTTGTTVNGCLIQECELNDCDHFGFGPITGVFFLKKERNLDEKHTNVANEQIFDVQTSASGVSGIDSQSVPDRVATALSQGKLLVVGLRKWIGGGIVQIYRYKLYPATEALIRNLTSATQSRLSKFVQVIRSLLFKIKLSENAQIRTLCLAVFGFAALLFASLLVVKITRKIPETAEGPSRESNPYVRGSTALRAADTDNKAAISKKQSNASDFLLSNGTIDSKKGRIDYRRGPLIRGFQLGMNLSEFEANLKKLCSNFGRGQTLSVYGVDVPAGDPVYERLDGAGETLESFSYLDEIGYPIISATVKGRQKVVVEIVLDTQPSHSLRKPRF